MDRTRLDAILSGPRTLAQNTPSARAVVIANDEVTACATVLSAVFAKRTSARPLALESSQLPAIF